MLKTIALIFISLSCSVAAAGQWIKYPVETAASFRGLSVVDSRVIWASGTGGTVIRTADGGVSWDVIAVPGAEKLDFRDIEAFDSKTAYILSIGNGDSSRIYKTVDGGQTWSLQFTNREEAAFYDALACWDRNNCIAMSDPVDGFYRLLETQNGVDWKIIDTEKMDNAKQGEAAFAASGTCLIAVGKSTAFLVTGGSDARVFRSDDRGWSWSVADTPIVKGTAGSGIFSIAMLDARRGTIVGGNYERPDDASGNLSFTVDGGRPGPPAPTFRATALLWRISTGRRLSPSERTETTFPPTAEQHGNASENRTSTPSPLAAETRCGRSARAGPYIDWLLSPSFHGPKLLVKWRLDRWIWPFFLTCIKYGRIVVYLLPIRLDDYAEHPKITTCVRRLFVLRGGS